MREIEELPFFEIASERFTRDPETVLERSRAIGPIVRSSRGIEVLTYRLGQAVLRERRAASDHMGLVERIGFPNGPALDFKKRMLLGQGLTERRARIRRIFSTLFDSVQMEGMRATIRVIVNDLLDDLNAVEPADLFKTFCLLLPARLYCAWVGAPKADALLVSRLSGQVLRIFDQDPKHRDSILAGYAELFPYVRDHIARARGRNDESLLAQLFAAADRGELSDDEFVDFVAMLLEASTDNTASQIAFTIGVLLGAPEQWQAVKDDEGLIPAAVRETIRLLSRSVTHQRTALEEFELADVRIPRGTVINVVSWAAHRDSEAFERPYEFDLRRPGATRALTFGGGAFSCLGHATAEVEIQESLRALARRFPRVALHSFRYEVGAFAATALELSATLEPGRPKAREREKQ